MTWKAAVPRRRIRLKDHPKGAEIRARLETLPRAARVRWWRVNAGRIKEGKDPLYPWEYPRDSSSGKTPPWSDPTFADLRTYAAAWEYEQERRRGRLRVIEGGKDGEDET